VSLFFIVVADWLVFGSKLWCHILSQNKCQRVGLSVADGDFDTTKSPISDQIMTRFWGQYSIALVNFVKGDILAETAYNQWRFPI